MTEPWDSDSEEPQEIEEPDPQEYCGGSEYARRALGQARARARERGLFPTSKKMVARDVRDRSTSAPGYSGARPDPRDPQGIESVLSRVLGDLGWRDGLAVGRVMSEWERIVGDQIAAHCTPVSCDDGVLVLSASSSAWATQMRLISKQLITRIHEEVGRNVVTEVKVTGPAAATWKKGRRTVTWRGPRDTYG
ncbi:DUF721 domain-containing protein [Devriesea agamarum]|uniref:DUF721 domain-containing protein n=1 Tax=Devriesea agamarum TaxID=472569 RepID=UPI000A00F1F2|nr:DciA family protein [Devriesea agamarum]